MINLIREILSEENKSIYRMTEEETKADERAAYKMLAWGFALGTGFFTLLWFAIAFALPVLYPIELDLPIILHSPEDMLLLDEEQETIGTPVTIPSEPDGEEWIVVKKRVQ